MYDRDLVLMYLCMISWSGVSGEAFVVEGTLEISRWALLVHASTCRSGVYLYAYYMHLLMFSSQSETPSAWRMLVLAKK